MDKFEVRDGIVKVTRAEKPDRKAAFFLRTFTDVVDLVDLVDQEDITGLGPVTENSLCYHGFTCALTQHFEFDEKYDVLQWVDQSRTLDPWSESPQPTAYVVCGWHSWLTALIVMQNSQPPAANCLLPVTTFTIVRKTEKETETETKESTETREPTEMEKSKGMEWEKKGF